MTKTYKVTFKPVEPYFFGNEKNFAFPGQKQKSIYAASYFIRSEKIPSQSTVLGALRYIFLPYKWENFSPADADGKNKDKQAANDKAIGPTSFDIDSEDAQEFGVIKKISPVFICGENEFKEKVTLIPTPMDHNRKDQKSERTHKDSCEKIHIYSPFDDYKSVKTTESTKYYAEDFDVKEGLEHSWVSLEKREIYPERELFESDLRIGINRVEKNDGFFKKEYCMLKGNFAFAVYAELDLDSLPMSACVFLGQGKSAFTVTFTEEENNLEGRVEEFLSKDIDKRADASFIYCLGDAFVSDFDNESVLFCAIDTKDYRAFKTRERGRIEKGGTLYRLIKAGGIIITDNPKEWVAKNMKENANKIGFNAYVIAGGK